MIRAEHIKFDYIRRDGEDNVIAVETAVNDVSFEVKPGEFVAILGHNGSGKSTLLRCLNMLETPSTGEINYHGTDITSKNVNVPEYRSKVGMVFQNFNLFNNMTALKNCTVGQVKVLKKSKEEAEKKALELLERVGLADRAGAYPIQLSGGQKQRVAIARALASDPQILLCDEATSALDPQTTSSILELLHRGDFGNEKADRFHRTRRRSFNRNSACCCGKEKLYRKECVNDGSSRQNNRPHTRSSADL